MKKILILCLFIAVFATTGCTKKIETQVVESGEKTTKQSEVSQPIVGNDKDKHGCIGSAGYLWCEEKQKCLRVREEKCEISSTNKTADWQTYKNEKYGYEISYPLNWYINSSFSDKDFYLRGDPADANYMGGDTYWSNYTNIESFKKDKMPADLEIVSLIIYKVDKNISIDDYVRNEYYKGDYYKKDIIKVIDFKTNNGVMGKEYHTVNTDAPTGVKGIFTVFKQDDNLYIFKSGWEEKDVHEKMLLTFKFTDNSI